MGFDYNANLTAIINTLVDYNFSGSNLVTNGCFESGNSFIFSSPAIGTVSSNYAHSGTKSLRTWSTSQFITGDISFSVTLSLNVKYKISGWSLSELGLPRGLKVRYDTATISIIDHVDNNPGEWKKHEGTFTPTVTTGVTILLKPSSNSGTDYSYYFDDINLVPLTSSSISLDLNVIVDDDNIFAIDPNLTTPRADRMPAIYVTIDNKEEEYAGIGATGATGAKKEATVMYNVYAVTGKYGGYEGQSTTLKDLYQLTENIENVFREEYKLSNTALWCNTANTQFSPTIDIGEGFAKVSLIQLEAKYLFR